MKTMQDKAVLVKFTDSVWIAKKRDRKIAEGVAKDHNAKSHTVGIYRKKLLPGGALDLRKSIGGKARDYHNRSTLPWMDDAVRVLPASMLKEYLAQMRKFQTEAEQADAAFFKQYTQHIAEAKVLLGKLFHEDDYPSAAKIREKFGFGITVLPLPSVADWRIDIPQKELDALRKEAEGTLNQVQKEAVADLWNRLAEVLEHVQERLSKDDNTFKNSLIGNVKDMVALLPKLNIGEDANLEAMRKEIEKKILAHTSDDLRDDAQIRATVRKDTAAILKKMSTYMGAGK